MAFNPYGGIGTGGGMVDPTWAGLTEKDVRDVFLSNLQNYQGRQAERKTERLAELGDVVDPLYAEYGLSPESMVGPMAGVTQKIKDLAFRHQSSPFGPPAGYDRNAIRELAQKFIRPSGTKDISEDIVYTTKLFKQRKDGTLGPLYIGSKQRIDSKGGKWLPFDEKLSKKGFGERPGWHAPTKEAPHIKTEAKGQDRVVRDVALRNWTVFPRPASQGSEWYLAGEMMVLPVKAAKKKKRKP